MSGTMQPRGFPQSEFEARTERAQRMMAERRLDALLFCTEPEVRYFTGFLTPFWQSPTRPWFLVVPRDGKPVAVIPEIGAALMGTTWLDDIRTWPSPRPDDEGVSLLAETLKGLAADPGRVGLPMGPETALRMPLNDYARLQALLRRTAFVDATDIVRSLRMVKSDAEIGKIADICHIVSDGFAAVPAYVRSGQPLAAVFTAFRTDLLKRGADEVPYLVGASAPGGYDDIIAPPDERPLAKGDVLMMDTGAVRDGYFADFDRNYAIGKADDATRKAHATLWAATEAGLEAARPASDLRRSIPCHAGRHCGSRLRGRQRRTLRPRTRHAAHRMAVDHAARRHGSFARHGAYARTGPVDRAGARPRA